MSQSFPPNPGGHQQSPYAGHPACLGHPASTAQPSGLNPWVAALLGGVTGAILTVIFTTVVPMLFFGLLMGGGMLGDDGFMGAPQGTVAVAPDGSVSGAALAEAVDGVAYYEDVTCPGTVKVATDATTICEADDGFEDLHVVVVFDGTDGRFSTADLWE